MRRRRRDRPARRLRVSIDALPRATKLAMLEGVRETPIIAGAYTSPEGTCPMLAAHRRGGRTSLATFARAWDGYTRVEGGPRPATERELRTLESMLEASLAAEEAPLGGGELARAIDEHREARERRARTEPRAAAPRRGGDRPGDPDRSRELRRRPGWAWLRVFRRLDEYETALAAAEQTDSAQAPAGAAARD
jgi:hypothetical protein